MAHWSRSPKWTSTGRHGPRQAIDDDGGTARTHIVDVTVPADVDRLASAVLAEHGRVDILVNNVGDYRPSVRFENSTPDSWKAMYDDQPVAHPGHHPSLPRAP